MQASPPPARSRTSVTERLKGLFDRYGTVGIIVYVVIAASVFFGAWLALAFGWNPEIAADAESMQRSVIFRWVVGIGSAGVAYAIYKLTMPFRIAAALLLTPLIVKLLERMRLRKPRAPA